MFYISLHFTALAVSTFNEPFYENLFWCGGEVIKPPTKGFYGFNYKQVMVSM